MGIGETLCRSLVKLVMRASGEQAKTACSNLQICARFEAGIEVATHAARQQRVERFRERRAEERAQTTPIMRRKREERRLLPAWIF